MNEATCGDCRGRGFIVDVETNQARRCGCHRQRVRGRRIDSLGIPPKYQRCRLDNFHLSGDVNDQLFEARRSCERYVEDFVEDDGTLRETGLGFVGPNGRGKTHLAVAVLVELAKRYDVQGRFIDFTSLIEDIKATYSPGAERNQADLLRPLQKADVVVVDELGAKKPSDFVSDMLHALINGRYMTGRPTLFTSNYYLTPEDDPESRTLADRIPASVVSRLHQMAKPLTIDAVGDYRHEVQAYQNR